MTNVNINEKRGFLRGDVYWVAAEQKTNHGGEYAGKGQNEKFGKKPHSSLIRGTRPAVIVSNDELNANSNVVEVAFLTRAPKGQLKSHAVVMLNAPSTVLCEQVQSVSVDKLGSYIGHLSDIEMSGVDSALRYSLGISPDSVAKGDDLWKARYEAMHMAYSEMLMHVMRIVKGRTAASPFPAATIETKEMGDVESYETA